MKVPLPFRWGSTYMLEEMPVHIHSKTEKEGSKKAKLQEADDSVGSTGDLAGVKGGRTYALPFTLLKIWIPPLTVVRLLICTGEQFGQKLRHKTSPASF